MFDTIKAKLKSAYEKTWAFFKNSGTILYSRAIAAFGFLVGAFASLDFSPLWSILQTGTEFTKQQLIGIGASIFGAAIVAEVVRRRGTKVVADTLIPTAAVLPEELTIKTKVTKKKTA